MNIHTSVADAFGRIQGAKHLFRKCAFAEASPADAFDVASVRGTCAVGVTALQDTWLSQSLCTTMRPNRSQQHQRK